MSQVGKVAAHSESGLVEEREAPQRGGVLRDQVIFFYKLAQKQAVSGG